MIYEGEDDTIAEKTIQPDVKSSWRMDIPDKTSLAVILTCSAISVFLMNTGVLSVLYLAPLGYAVMATGHSWFTFFTAAAVNIIFLIIGRTMNPGVSVNALIEILYISTLFFMFIWIIGGKNLRTMYRFIFGSIAGAAVFMFFITRPETGILKMFNEMIEILHSSFVSRGRVSGVLTVQTLQEMVKGIMLKGGALMSIFFLFYLNRQLAVSAFWMIKKRKTDRGLEAFFAPSSAIWVLSGALVTILLTRLFKMQIPEILAWNVLSVCVVIFMTQGAGILYFFLSRLSYTFRLAVNAAVIAVLISPLNVIVIAALTLLGIAEIWRPIRTR